MTICLQYAGPHAHGVPIDPDSDAYLVAMSDMSAPTMIHFAPASPAPAPAPRCRHSSPVGRLTEATALIAIHRICGGEMKSAIARELGVSRSAVTSVAHGRSWAHLPWPVGFGPCPRGRREVTRHPA